MTPIRIVGGLPFITVEVIQNGMTLRLQNVLLDTGAARTIFATDVVSAVGVAPDANAGLRRMVGIGGTEWVVEATSDAVVIDSVRVENVVVQLGGLQYGFALDGIVGLDLLRAVRATIDLDALELYTK